MTDERRLEIATMELSRLREELIAGNEKIDATPADSDGFPVPSLAYLELLVEQTVIKDRIDVIRCSAVRDLRTCREVLPDS